MLRDMSAAAGTEPDGAEVAVTIGTGDMNEGGLDRKCPGDVERLKRVDRLAVIKATVREGPARTTDLPVSGRTTSFQASEFTSHRNSKFRHKGMTSTRRNK